MWASTSDNRVEVCWEGFTPVAVSVTLAEGDSIDDGWLEEFLSAECRCKVALAGDAGHWEAGEADGECVRNLEVV